ncbi:MAG: GcrA-like regulator [Bradyrhizobium sp.]|uniref:GcrA family cell cycle regulator n=1 Tax=Bradyrhizobium sp. TaxID=376 RepID=UPI00120A86C9|nr:GcrA family cell cycle regulator [Bradyrhizobium sp.]THD68313.1 MAG: GcrA-like regulator [Bradyrhizobium sp.]
MPATAPTWTEERIERLKNRFEAGLSCREIACDIGVSRNAVIGKLSRLNLTREKTSDAPRPTRKDPAKAKRPKSVPRLQYRMLQALYAEPAADHEPIHNGQCCSLLELSKERCRWPISTPGADDFRFCGNPPVEGLPYCAGHTRIAYRPGSRQRVARG